MISIFYGDKGPWGRVHSPIKIQNGLKEKDFGDGAWWKLVLDMITIIITIQQYLLFFVVFIA